jgi:hypothetical protein
MFVIKTASIAVLSILALVVFGSAFVGCAVMAIATHFVGKAWASIKTLAG